MHPSRRMEVRVWMPKDTSVGRAVTSHHKPTGSHGRDGQSSMAWVGYHTCHAALFISPLGPMCMHCTSQDRAITHVRCTCGRWIPPLAWWAGGCYGVAFVCAGIGSRKAILIQQSGSPYVPHRIPGIRALPPAWVIGCMCVGPHPPPGQVRPRVWSSVAGHGCVSGHRGGMHRWVGKRIKGGSPAGEVTSGSVSSHSFVLLL